MKLTLIISFIYLILYISIYRTSQVASVLKNLPANAGEVRDAGLIPGSRIRWGGNGTPLQYFCLKNPMDWEAWWATAHRVAKSQTWLKQFSTHNNIWFLPVSQIVKNLPAVWETWVQSLGWEDPLEKGMATHSSILAWRILWTEEPAGLQSMGS